jgi:asparagine N-glycosylation enzyme membrane subunit Stt3
MLWAYFSFSQFLIIWTGNTTEEIPFYMERMFTSWGWISVALVLLQFFVPFLLLLSRDVKRNSGRMIALTGLVLFARLVETYWITIPGWFPSGFHVHWLDLAAPVAIGGVWVSMFAMQLRSRPLLPERDPRLTEVLGHAA